MINNQKSFFSVCTLKKANFIPENYRSLNRFYKNIKYSVIVPKREIVQFTKFFESKKLNDINIVNEEQFISISDFKEILLNLCKEKNIELNKRDFDRIGWYYQQVLKLSFLFEESKNYNYLIMIDSDTILFKKLTFFKDNLQSSLL